MRAPTEKSLIHPGPKFPYESSWLLYLKLLQWNNFRDFRRLLNFLDPSAIHGAQGANWWNLNSSAVNVIVRALNRSSDSVNLTFVDGWFPRSAVRDYELDPRTPMHIRHCPDCVSYGYHSVIFYFDCIKVCPWHNKPLELCKFCRAALTMDWPLSKGVYGSVGRCSHLEKLLDVMMPDISPNDFSAGVISWCDEFKIFSQASQDLVGKSAYDVLVERNGPLMNTGLAIDYLLQASGSSILGARHAFELSLLRYSSSEIVDLPEALPELVEVNSSVKAVRRYIFNRYIRRHRRCLAMFKSLSRDQWCTLNANTACPCVLAYLLITSKHLSTSPYGYLNDRLVVNAANHYLKSSGSIASMGRLEWSTLGLLAKFYELWTILRHPDDVEQGRLVFVNQYHHPVWNNHPAFFYDGRSWSCTSRLAGHFYMENPQVVIDQSVSVCRSRAHLSITTDAFNYKPPSFIATANVHCVVCKSNSKNFGCRDIHI